MPDLQGSHLRLRELRARDHTVYERIYTSHALTRFLGVDRKSPEEAHDAFTAALAQQHAHPRRRYTVAVCPPDDDRMIGTIGLLVEDYGRNAMLTGLVVVPDAPVRGQAHEAGRLLMAYGFGPLGLHRIWAGHRADHTRMSTVMSAAGLLPEARLRQLFRTQDTWHDVTTYSALAPQWREDASQGELRILHGAMALTAERGTAP
ncbi:GNAT family protein [Streptomyces sp. NPDC051940]|uniref:GNAT family N-acetyltransferase n=1 Tax=Streptomyces sp. NPDC051940 TaxID=3155675 RepID=UPI003449A12D